MADVLNERITNCLDDCEELTKRIEAVEAVQDDLSDRVYKQEYWRDGNGARGAEIRLQCTEAALSSLPAMKSDLDAVKLVADAKLIGIEDAVGKAIDARNNTILAYVKSFSPYAAALAAILVAIFK
jgi:hypothetical protein